MDATRTQLDRRRRRGTLASLGAVLVLAAVLTHARASAVEVPPVPVPVLVFHDGDHVVYDAKGADSGDGSVIHAGFTTYDDAMALPSYEIRLTSSDGVEAYRPLVEQAAAAVTAAGGPVLHVAAGQVPPGTTPQRGQILVEVSSYSPCGGTWLGCGGPTLDGGVVVSGALWLNPRLSARPANEVENTVRHEVGHTVGLAHYSGAYEGRVQTMHPTRFDAASYEAGDRAGFRFLRGDAGPPPPAPAPPPTTPTGVDPAGAVETVEPGTFGILIRGWAVDPDAGGPAVVVVTVDGRPTEIPADKAHATAGGHGFALVWLDGPGTHDVCVAVRNAGAGRDLALGCRAVDLSAESIGLIGLQTV